VQVRDVMTEATITETPADKLRSGAERMWRERTGSLLITTDGRLTGIITERDVLRAVALGADPDRATVDEAMTIDVFTVPPDRPLQVAAREMAARLIRHLPVVENGQLLGVASMRDVTWVFGALGAGDSEIDIEHEFDQLVHKRRLARIERSDLPWAGPGRSRLSLGGGAGREDAYGSSNGSGRPSSACAQASPGWLDGSSATRATTRSRSRATLAANTLNTSAWVTPSPASMPASRSVTRASGI
jgi:CBS domain-containing protein